MTKDWEKIVKNEIKKTEKKVLHPYFATKDEEKRGIATIGYGFCFYSNNEKVKITDKRLTDEECEKMFDEIFEQRVSFIRSKLKCQTTDYQLYALVMFCYQQGYGNFLSSSVFKAHNAGNFEQCAKNFVDKKYSTQGGVYLLGLHKRRFTERQIYLGNFEGNNNEKY